MLQVIFAVDPKQPDYRQTPVDLFLSLSHEGADMESVLTDWYSAPIKDLNAFEQSYPARQRFTADNQLCAERMYEFCNKAEIAGTPTIFINGQELPDTYRIADLPYFLI